MFVCVEERMASTTEKRDGRNPTAASGHQARNQPPERVNPGCSILILSGIILLIVSMGIVGILFLIGLDLHEKFWLVFFIFAAVGAFMYQLAKIIQNVLVKKGE